MREQRRLRGGDRISSFSQCFRSIDRKRFLRVRNCTDVPESARKSYVPDDVDRRILKALNENARKSFRDIARELSLALSTVSN
ncbi:MAG TPA: AsnC family transcriptional regulator, partial [Candidatus Thermoplasmatota archaeon]|nr:AsnC family transcriptional regulator [Candidatus Thermoplasmatota archaeon]